MSTKAWAGNFFEDFQPGQRLTCPVPRTLTVGDAALYTALTGDRTALFSGPEAPLHPLVVFHSSFGQTVRNISLNARANLGYADIRWQAPVYPGDTLTTELEILGCRPNANGTTGVVWVGNRCTNQRGETVLSYTRWVMVRRRTDGALGPGGAPALPDHVHASTLAGMALPSRIPRGEHTGGCFGWEDYAPGEVLHHSDGMQVGQGDHMSFTRLFQNSARVHFDAHGMKGRPLIYGGVVISLGYALALNGLENRLGLCAINAGSHVNPTWEGDTLYAVTRVLDTAALDDTTGLLRLQMLVFKNSDAGRAWETLALPGEGGRPTFAPEVVLSLDYWERILRRDALR
jgi:2-methylfumaryl-CoA hydratase